MPLVLHSAIAADAAAWEKLHMLRERKAHVDLIMQASLEFSDVIELLRSAPNAKWRIGKFQLEQTKISIYLPSETAQHAEPCTLSLPRVASEVLAFFARPDVQNELPSELVDGLSLLERELDRMLTALHILDLLRFSPSLWGHIGQCHIDRNCIRLAAPKNNVRSVRALLSLPCTPLELLAFSLSPDRGVALHLPETFAVGVQARHRDDLWCDKLLAKLRMLGLDRTNIDYAKFLAVTTFDPEMTCNSHTDADRGRYVLRRDGAGVVIGIEAGPAFRGKEQEGEHQAMAHLKIPHSLEQLVRWIRRQCGDVELRTDDAGEIAKLLSEHSGLALSEAIHPATTRDNAGRRAITEAIECANGDRREHVIRRELIHAATRAQNEGLEFPFRVANGKLQAYRSRKWSDYDVAALTKRIDALPTGCVSDKSE